MAKDYTTRSAEEATTYRLFDEYLTEDNWTSHMALVAHVFKTMYYSSLRADRAAKIAAAIGYLNEEPDLTASLDALVKAKVLRKRRERKVTFYEVNY